ncbi:peptidyl-prolyl cis-trans isomerase [Pseudalkalibacillus berkeleyi]|uniref:Peptidyl-prolyl cis-trans isomerase n=1 Tax=Pseudalkalibacillus berkeleyi TaxID=1069813 RepID=A0ABS9GVW8_9BACL|nr:peptidyl-prolyl cis-trans isomerase [Pseudalkalibacillus berkeleyi]MCF6136962.1 peptidyl-prolyl cis-trans isomerase [Pseudalkalibacillus berkeleyi]
MESIVFIKGNVNYTITLDPGVWIFDDRKVDLDTYFDEQPLKVEDHYAKRVAEHWERERKEGAKGPVNTNQNKIQYDKEELFSKSYGIPFLPFLENASPNESASKVEFQTSTDESLIMSLDEAKAGILGFSKNGKPLSDGPVHFYYADGSNRQQPFRNIVRMVVK